MLPRTAGRCGIIGAKNSGRFEGILIAGQKLTQGEPAPAAPGERAKDTGWFAEVTDVLFELTKAHERSIGVLIDLAVALGVSGVMLAVWGEVVGYYPAIAAAIALVALGGLVTVSSFGYFLWISIRDVMRWRAARQGNGSSNATMQESGKATPWFLELGDTLYDRCRPAHRALCGVGIIIVAALAGLYLGRYAGIYYLEIGGAAVFGLGGIAWAMATGYLAAVLIRGVARWRSGRVR